MIYQYFLQMIKVDQAFSEEVLIQRITTQQSKEIDINYFELGEYRGRDSHATYHNIKLYRSFLSEKVGDVFLLKRILVEDHNFADQLLKNQLRVVHTPDKQIRDKILKCEFHWKENGNHYLAFENPSYGMLKQFLEEAYKMGEQLTEPQIVFILKGILLALRQLHKQNIYHQNLKMSNIAICDNFQIKLHDLSFSKYKDYSSIITLKGALTPRYDIPSRHGKDSDGEYDIQAFGVILYYLIHGIYPYKNNKQSSFTKNKSKIIEGLEKIWDDLVDQTQCYLSIEQILYYQVFQTDQNQEKKTRQKLQKKYSKYRESLIQHKKWGRNTDKNPIKLSDQLLQIAKCDLKVSVIRVIRERESLAVLLSNQNVIRINNKDVKTLDSSKKLQIDNKKYAYDEFKELNCTVTKFGIVNDVIFIRLSNDLICIALNQASKDQRGTIDQVLMTLNYNRSNPSLIKIVTNGKQHIFSNYKEGLAKEPSLITYVKTVFEKMLENSSISA